MTLEEELSLSGGPSGPRPRPRCPRGPPELTLHLDAGLACLLWEEDAPVLARAVIQVHPANRRAAMSNGLVVGTDTILSSVKFKPLRDAGDCETPGARARPHSGVPAGHEGTGCLLPIRERRGGMGGRWNRSPPHTD